VSAPESQQVSWYPVHLFVNALVSQANCGPIPLAGTPAWQQLADGDPRKLLAVAEAGVHWCLRIDALQQQRAEAAKDIAGAADWSALAGSIRRRAAAERSGQYIPRCRKEAS